MPAKTPPLACVVSAACMAKTLPLVCVSPLPAWLRHCLWPMLSPMHGKTLHLACVVSDAWLSHHRCLAFPLPFRRQLRAGPSRKARSNCRRRHGLSRRHLPAQHAAGPKPRRRQRERLLLPWSAAVSCLVILALECRCLLSRDPCLGVPLSPVS